MDPVDSFYVSVCRMSMVRKHYRHCGDVAKADSLLFKTYRNGEIGELVIHRRGNDHGRGRKTAGGVCMLRAPHPASNP